MGENLNKKNLAVLTPPPDEMQQSENVKDASKKATKEAREAKDIVEEKYKRNLALAFEQMVSEHPELKNLEIQKRADGDLEDFAKAAGFSYLYYVRDKESDSEDGFQYVLKVTSLDNSRIDLSREVDRKAGYKRAKQEIDVLNKLNKGEKELSQHIMPVITTHIYTEDPAKMGDYKTEHLFLILMPCLITFNQYVSWLCENNALNNEVLKRVLTHIGKGLKLCHKMGFIHRDVKPDNFFVSFDEDDEPIFILGDFGIVRYVDERTIESEYSVEDDEYDGMQLCRPLFTSTGTKGYLAPEIEEGKPIRPGCYNSDVYSMGATYLDFVDLKGTPYKGRRTQIEKVCDRDNIIYNAAVKALNKDPNYRQQTIDEFIKDINDSNDTLEIFIDDVIIVPPNIDSPESLVRPADKPPVDNGEGEVKKPVEKKIEKKPQEIVPSVETETKDNISKLKELINAGKFDELKSFAKGCTGDKAAARIYAYLEFAELVKKHEIDKFSPDIIKSLESDIKARGLWAYLSMICLKNHKANDTLKEAAEANDIFAKNAYGRGLIRISSDDETVKKGLKYIEEAAMAGHLGSIKMLKNGFGITDPNFKLKVETIKFSRRGLNPALSQKLSGYKDEDLSDDNCMKSTLNVLLEA